LVGKKDNGKPFTENDLKCLKDLSDALIYGLPQVVTAQKVIEGWGREI
jgi:hypothetical protein